MTLRIRFLLSLIAVIAIMAVSTLYGVSRIAEMRDIALDLREQAANSALAVGRLGSAIEQLDRYQRLYLVTSDSALAAGYAAVMYERLEDAAGALEELRTGGYADAVASADIPIDDLREATDFLGALVTAGLRAPVAADRAALLARATTYRELAADPLLDRAVAAVPQLGEAIDRHTAARFAVAERTANTATTAATTAMIIAIVLAGALAVAAAGVLSRPLQRLASAMARVADGVFDTPRNLPYEREDELGDLSRSFRAMTARLAQLDRMKAEFLGAASQGLKTPIGVIGGYAEMIREEADGDLTPRHRELLVALSEQTEVLRRRLDQLLEMSRMESGTLTLGLEEIYLRHFVAELERTYVPRAAARGVQLRVRLDESTPPFLVADPDLLRVEILGNVIDNAIRFTPAGGTVDLSVRQDAELIVFEVADSGPGLPEEQLEQIFQKYGDHRESAAGTGFGLAIARAAVQAHNGRIDARNLPGGGARFRVALPLTQSSLLESNTDAPGADTGP